MLRTLFVIGLMLFGAYFAVQSAFGGLLFYLWIAYFRPEFWVWNGEFLQNLNLSLIVGVYLVLRSLTSAEHFRLDLRSGLLFLFLAITCVSTMTSSYVTVWSSPFQDFVKLLIVTYLLAGLTTDISRVRLVLLVIAFSLGFESAKQGWATLILHPGAKNANEIAMLGDENEVAVGLMMLAPVLFALAQTARKTWEKRLHQFVGIGVAYRALSTYSRGGFLAAGAMALVYVARAKHKVRSAVFVAVVGTALLSVLPDAFWNRMSTIQLNQDQAEDTSAQGRLHFWRVAVLMANDNPLLGVGHFGFQSAFNKYDFTSGLYGRDRAVHSAWFGLLAETGYVGLLVFVGIIWLAVTACETVIRRARRGQIPAAFGSYGVAIQTGLAVFCVGGSFVTFQYREIVWHWIGLSMALRAVAMTATVPEASPAAVRAPQTVGVKSFVPPVTAWPRTGRRSAQFPVRISDGGRRSRHPAAGRADWLGAGGEGVSRSRRAFCRYPADNSQDI